MRSSLLIARGGSGLQRSARPAAALATGPSLKYGSTTAAMWHRFRPSACARAFHAATALGFLELRVARAAVVKVMSAYPICAAATDVGSSRLQETLAEEAAAVKKAENRENARQVLERVAFHA